VRYRFFPVVTAVFVTCLVVSNIIAVKPIAIGPFFLPVAVVIFPLSYLFGDILTEVYGYSRARQVIWIGFGCNVLTVAAIGLSIAIPPAPFWQLGALPSPEKAQEAYASLFAATPRLLIASFLAYLAGEFLNATVLAKIKIAMQGRHLWVRTISSTIVGQLADSLLFITLAFYGTFPGPALANMVLTQWVAKSLYEALLTPFTYAVVNFLKKTEQEDFYDYDTSFNPFRRSL
jgi:queuosine precursor transporter